VIMPQHSAYRALTIFIFQRNYSPP
jgi:hypothetical protein